MFQGPEGVGVFEDVSGTLVLTVGRVPRVYITALTRTALPSVPSRTRLTSHRYFGRYCDCEMLSSEKRVSNQLLEHFEDSQVLRFYH